MIQPIIKLWLVESRLVADFRTLKENLDEHLTYQDYLEQTGVLFAAGPVFDKDGKPTTRGLIFLSVDSEEAARSHADRDPFHRLGIRAYELFRWSANEGTLRAHLDPSVHGD